MSAPARAPLAASSSREACAGKSAAPSALLRSRSGRGFSFQANATSAGSHLASTDARLLASGTDTVPSRRTARSGSAHEPSRIGGRERAPLDGERRHGELRLAPATADQNPLPRFGRMRGSVPPATLPSRMWSATGASRLTAQRARISCNGARPISVPAPNGVRRDCRLAQPRIGPSRISSPRSHPLDGSRRPRLGEGSRIAAPPPRPADPDRTSEHRC